MRDTPKLSLCMIVRENESTIRPCLESIKPYVDEMVVVDTGSTDRTPEICRELGARLFEFPWCDDFSAARNESLKYAEGEWIFWMDSDDTIPPKGGEKLRQLAEGDHEPHILGYIMQVRCPSADGQDVTTVDHVKLFPNRPDLQFEHRIHEQILPAIRRAGGDVAFTDIFVVHSGSDHSEEGRQRKLERDFRILEQDLAERPDHPFVLFNLGMTCADAERYDEAADYLQRSIEVAQPDESHLRKAYALLVSAYTQSNRHDEAWDACCRGRELFADDRELLFRSGMLNHHFGRLHEAESSYLRILNGHPDRHFESVDQGIISYKARHNLAVVYEEMQELERAEVQWVLVTGERSDYRPGWRGLGNCLLKQERLNEVHELADRLASNSTTQRDGQLLLSRLLTHAGRINDARTLLEGALETDPNESELLQKLCRLLFERYSPVEAELALRRLAVSDEADAAVRHNLGTVCLSTGRIVPAGSLSLGSQTVLPRKASSF